MVYYRALGFGLRDEFADVLKGTKTVEELMDYPVEEERQVLHSQHARRLATEAGEARKRRQPTRVGNHHPSGYNRGKQPDGN